MPFLVSQGQTYFGNNLEGIKNTAGFTLFGAPAWACPKTSGG